MQIYFYPKELCINVGGFENEEINWFLSWPSHCCCTATAAIQWISREWKTLHLHCADKYGWNSSNISLSVITFFHIVLSLRSQKDADELDVAWLKIEFVYIRISIRLWWIQISNPMDIQFYSNLLFFLLSLSLCMYVCVSLFRKPIQMRKGERDERHASICKYIRW